VAKEAEPTYDTSARIRFEYEADRCVEMIRSVKPTRATIPDPYLADAQHKIERAYRAPKGEFYEKWVADFATVMAATCASVGGAFAVAIGFDLDLSDPEIAQVSQLRSKRLAAYVSQTTSDAVTAAIHSARELGLSMDETAELVRSACFGDEITKTRAMTIARTETIGCMNAAELATAKLSGVVETKEWLTQGDDKVRGSHAEQEGEERALDEAFTNGCQHPGDPEAEPEETINCRCTLLYHTKAEIKLRDKKLPDSSDGDVPGTDPEDLERSS
jgi:hypothetical protein